MNHDDGIAGAVMGLCVGNALGAPLKNAKPGAIRSAFGVVADYVDARDMLGAKLNRWSTPGLYGADAQLALALLDVCIESRGLNAERAAALLAELARCDEGLPHGVLRGAGADVSAAVENHSQGVPWRRAGHDWPGGAPAARIAPIALFYADNPRALPDAVIESALLTNRNPVSVSAAAAVAAITLEMIEKDSLAPDERGNILEKAAAFSREIEKRLIERYADVLDFGKEKQQHEFSETLADLTGRLDHTPADVEAWICENATERSGIEVKRPTRDVALASVIYAIYIFLANGESFERAVSAAINQGGDADAIGAIVGAMAGALHGESGIPERWIKGLANRKQIQARARALARGRGVRAQTADFLAMEADLTRKEMEEREAVMRRNRKFLESRDKKQRREQQQDKPRKKQKIDKMKIRKFKETRLWEQYIPPRDNE